MIALAALAAVACQEKGPSGNDGETKAPVLGAIQGVVLDAKGADITTTYEAADFGQQGLIINYALFVDKAGNKMAGKQEVTAAIADGKITVSQANMSLAIMSLGYEVDEEADVDLALYAYVGSAVTSSALVSNYVTAKFTTCAAKVDPNTLPKIWVIGNFNGWSFDNVATNCDYLYDFEGNGTYSGLVYYAAKANTGWKMAIPSGSAGDYKWDDTANWGFGDEVPEEEALTATLVCKGSSSDMKKWSHNFYEWHFTPETLELKMEAPDNWDNTPTPVGFDYMYLVGNFNDWKEFDDSFKMKYIPTTHTFYVDAELPDNAEIKFIADGQLSNKWYIAWGENGEWEAGNIKVEKGGKYRVYFDFNAKSYTLDTAAFGQEEEGGIDVAIRDFNKPDEYFIYGNVMGSDWSKPVGTLAKDGDTEVYKYQGLPYKAGETFKIVKNEKEVWYGVSQGSYDGTLNKLTGDNDFKFEKDGVFDVEFNAETEQVTIHDAAIQGWAVIGNVGGTSWSKDFVMTQNGNIWTSETIAFEGEFKIRFGGNWAAGDYGATEEGVTAVLDTPIALSAGGKNIKYEGEAKAVFDAENLTLTLKK